MAAIDRGTPKRRYVCDGCGKEDFWNDSWSWYGSGAHLDTCPQDVPVACSPECAKIIEAKVKSGEFRLPRLKNKKYYSVVVEERKGY